MVAPRLLVRHPILMTGSTCRCSTSSIHHLIRHTPKATGSAGNQRQDDIGGACASIYSASDQRSSVIAASFAAKLSHGPVSPSAGGAIIFRPAVL